MKISRILLKGHKQFQNLDLDLTYPKGHPKAGKALEKVCLIGKNGTGKSTLLNCLFSTFSSSQLQYNPIQSRGYYMLKLELGSKSAYYCPPFRKMLFTSEFENTDFFEELDKTLLLPVHELTKASETRNALLQKQEKIPNSDERYRTATFQNNAPNLLVYCLPEANKDDYVGMNDVPMTSLNDVQTLFNNIPFAHNVSTATSRDFWNYVIYQVKLREKKELAFFKHPDMKNVPGGEISARFEKENPHFLERLGELWNRILEPAGLEFDIENAVIPTQLNQNLKAYIKLKSSGAQIHYRLLSTGIRNFIFRLGHIYSLYFNRDIQKGLLFLDEPENSLFPDFLFDLVQEYVNIAPNTQIFIATHSPIIAAQFEPEERIILDFDTDGNVVTRRGSSPIGDDPNDLLSKDFLVRSLYGKEGQEKWNRFLELKKIIPNEQDKEKKDDLLSELLEIGTKYGFSSRKERRDRK